MSEPDNRDPSRFRRAEDEQLADAAMSLLGCRTADDVYEVIGDFMTLLCPGTLIVVDEISPAMDFYITRRIIGLDIALLAKASELVGFEFSGKRWDIDPAFRDQLLTGTLWRVPGGFAELTAGVIPRPLAAIVKRTFGIHDLFVVGIADRAHALGNFAILTRTADIVLPTHIIESFARHCYSALAGIARTRELVESAERSDLLLDSMTEGLALHEIVLDAAGKPCDYRFLDVNPAFEAMTGLRARDIVGHTVLEVLPGIEPSWIERYGSVATTGVAARFEDYAGDLDRHYQVVAFSPQPGQFATLISDITRRKQSEAALERSRVLLQSSLESQRDTILFSIDRDYRYLFFNQAHADAMEGAWGTRPEPGMCVLDLITSEGDRDLSKRNYDRALAGESHSNIHEFGDIKRAYYESFFNPILDESGTVIGATGMARDITSRMRSEAELKANHEMLVNLTAQVPGVVYQYRLNPDGSSAFPFSSRGMNDIYEYAPEEVREDATPVFGRLHPDDYDRVAGDIEESARTLEPFHCEFRVVLPRQGLRWRLSDALPQRTEDGGTLWYGIISDSTERMQAIEDRRQDLERLVRALASTVEMVSQVVETRDPYTAGHQRRVSELAVRISQELGMTAGDVDEIRTAALIHDVGKMAVPAEILSRPGPLSAVEFELVKAHAEAGYRIISSANMEGSIAEIVYQHHERCDGSGYPRGLQSEDLLTASKVLMVADVAEAMMSHRPYRPTLGRDAALAEIERGAGTHYDADVCRACAAVLRDQRFELST